MSDTNLAADATEPVLNADPVPETAPELPLETPPQPDTAPPPRMIPVGVLERRLRNEQERVNEFRNRAERAERAAEEARQLAERLQRNGADPNASPPPRYEPPQQNIDAEVERRAMEINFGREVGQVDNSGKAAYGVHQWNDYVSVLNACGINTAPFLNSIIEIAGRDKTHQVIREIASDPGRAEALNNLSDNQRIAEITRISERMATKTAVAAAKPAEPVAAPAKTISQAPKPAPRVEAHAGEKREFWDDKVSDAEFSKGWNDRYMNRGARR